MKRNYKQWMTSLACLGLLTLGACGGEHGFEDFDEDSQNSDVIEAEKQESGEFDSWGQCTDGDWSACNVFAGEVCISGLCVGGSGGGGGGGECSHSIDCPNVDDICSRGVCI